MANILNWFNPRLTQDFHIKEFACKEKGGVAVPWDLLGNVQALAENLQILRDKHNKRIVIISGWRGPLYNASVGGVDGSYHTKAMAADLTIVGMTPKQVYNSILTEIKEGRMQDGGLGLYNTFVHYDIGDIGDRW